MSCTLIGIVGLALVLAAIRRDGAVDEMPERAPVPIRVDDRLPRR